MAYHKLLNGMVERRMRQSIQTIAGLWYTAWVNAGQPDLSGLSNKAFTDSELKEWEELNAPLPASPINGRSCSN